MIALTSVACLRCCPTCTGISAPFQRNTHPQPGSVYTLKSAAFAPLFPDVAKMIAPFLPKGKTTDEEFQKQVEAVAAEVVPVAVEASPSCDHAQGNLIVARLVGGFMVPVDAVKKFKSTLGQSVWKLAPLWISVDGGKKASYALLINCLLVSSCSLDLLKKEKALFRIRSQAFATLQVCFGSHASRPGMLLLR
jgi:hypothetical protein